MNINREFQVPDGKYDGSAFVPDGAKEEEIETHIDFKELLGVLSKEEQERLIKLRDNPAEEKNYKALVKEAELLYAQKKRSTN